MARTRWRVGLLAAVAAGLGVAASVIPATAAHATTGCRVTYTVIGQFPGGFTAWLGITNLGADINGWNLMWTFPSDQRVTRPFNAKVTSLGAEVTATNVSYNGAIASNSTVFFGFNGSSTGTNPPPDSFALNGTDCTTIIGETASG